MSKLSFITFDEKLEASWGLHKIEKAVLEKEIAELRAENEKLRRAMHDIYEVYAGSDGMLYGTSQFYVRQLIKQMADIAAEHKRAAAAAISDIERL